MYTGRRRRSSRSQEGSKQTQQQKQKKQQQQQSRNTFYLLLLLLLMIITTINDAQQQQLHKQHPGWCEPGSYVISEGAVLCVRRRSGFRKERVGLVLNQLNSNLSKSFRMRHRRTSQPTHSVKTDSVRERGRDGYRSFNKNDLGAHYV